MFDWKKYTLRQYWAVGKSCMKKTIAQLVGMLFYDYKYLKGKDFSGYKYSNGWQWVMRDVFMQKIVGVNRHIPYPVSFRMTVMNYENIFFDIDDLDNFQKVGSYFQAAADAYIFIGKGTYIAGNVGIITANHDLNNLEVPAPGKSVRIGEKCWIGMNSMILPGVELGEHTIVGAGSVVTKSFPAGNCVIAGNPAKCIRELNDVTKNNE